MMFNEITVEKNVCIKKKFYNSIFSVFILKILLCCCHEDWCFKFVGFLRHETEDDKNNDRIYYLELVKI